MKRSARADAFVKSFEKLRLRGYLPTPNDVPTIGWGQTGRGITLTTVWTREQADAAYEKHANGLDREITEMLDGAPTTQGQFDALFSFAYNVGADNDADRIAEGLGDSTLFRLHKAGDFKGAAAQFGKWVFQGKTKLRGLVRRREGERALYLS
jgi:lysozyme